jgi:radical SAM superfamily enzyme YgiQ (UPF0313 family)
MGAVESRQLGAGRRILGKRNGEIRIALIRPLGTLGGSEEREAVKEMGEPYQLELLASVLMQAGYQVRIFDQLAGPYDAAHHLAYPATKPIRQIVTEVEAFQPDVAAFTSFTYNFRSGLAIASELKTSLGIPILAGGYHITSVGKQHLLFDSMRREFPQAADVFRQDLTNVFQHGIVDYACIGEGIQAILAMLEVLKGNLRDSEVPGIAFLCEGQLTASCAPRLDPNSYPVPFREESFDPMMYYATGRGYPFLLLTTASGCRFACKYCSTGSMNYPRVMRRSDDSVVSELRMIYNRFHRNWPANKIMLNITDEDFAADPLAVARLFDAIKNEGLSQYFEFNSFMDNSSPVGEHGERMLGSLSRAGYSFSFVGIESTLEDALKEYRRPDRVNNRLAAIQAAIDALGAHGIMYFGDHMAGYPGHSLEMLRQDYENLFLLRRMHYVYTPILAPMPGTPLYWEVLAGALGEGFLPGVTYDDLSANQQVLNIPGGGNVKQTRNEYVQKFFTRPEYEGDATAAIGKNPSARTFFARMLPKISEDYPENAQLGRLAEKFKR